MLREQMTRAEHQQQIRQHDFQGRHHERLPASEAARPPVPPTANLHALQAAASLVSGDGGGGDSASSRRPASQHPAVQQHRLCAPGSSLSSQQQQQRSYQTAAQAGPPHPSRQANVTYAHLGSAATHGVTADPAHAGNDIVVGGSPSSRNLHSVAGVERGALGDVRGGGVGLSTTTGVSRNIVGSVGHGPGVAEAGLSAAARGPSSWNRAEDYGATGGGPVPGNPTRRAGVSPSVASHFGIRPPASVAGVTVPGFGAIAGGAGMHPPPSSEPQERRG
ncbi:unnamed protein product [Scytosiphon promiscuus]